MTEKQDNILRKIHASSPLWLSRLYTPFVYFIRHLRTFFQRRYYIEGLERVSEVHLRVAYFGHDIKIRNYWEQMMFGESTKTVQETKTPLWRIGKFASNNNENFDLVLVEISRLSRLFIRKNRGYLLPRWFDTMLDIKDSLNALQKYGIERKISQYGYSFEEKFSEDDLIFFFERMFTPYIESRHKDSAVMVDYNYFLKRFHKKDSGLFFLMKDNLPVAATFNERKEGMLKLSGLGVLDGDIEILKMDAIRALYFFILKHYNEAHVKTINFGGTSPLISDGLSKFKRSLRAYPNSKKLLGEKSLWLIPLSDSIATKSLLLSNPFIHISQGKVIRALFIDTLEIGEKKELLRLLKETRFREIARTEIHCWNGTQKISQWIAEEGLSGIEVKNFKIQK